MLFYYKVRQQRPSETFVSTKIFIYLSGIVIAVAVFRNPNTIPFYLTTESTKIYGLKSRQTKSTQMASLSDWWHNLQ
jgi:hypothetical protein